MTELLWKDNATPLFKTIDLTVERLADGAARSTYCILGGQSKGERHCPYSKRERHGRDSASGVMMIMYVGDCY
jgi:hypothetical protein